MSESQRQVLVTGSSGLVGSKAVLFFDDLGWRVLGLDNNMRRHFFLHPLSYTGFGGTGKQVRDVLHIEDLFELIVAQCQSPDSWNGDVFNIGGGRAVSVSLAELTALCQAVTGRRVEITPVPETHAVDLRIYLTDAEKARRTFGWTPRRSVETIIRDTHAWIAAQPELLASVLL